MRKQTTKTLTMECTISTLTTRERAATPMEKKAKRMMIQMVSKRK